MLDVNELMKDLASRRPVFHSEADFQLALAWHMHEVNPDVPVRLEWPVELPESGKRIYVDLWLPGGNVAVELKYRTRKLEIEHDGEIFALRNQGAQDLSRYDFVKDIERLEQLSQSDFADVQAGFAIMLTNDHLYWKEPTPNGKPTNGAEFRLHESRTIEGKMEWPPKASPGTIKGREDRIDLKASFPLRWRDYSEVGDGAYQQFRYLAIRIGASSNLGEQR